VLSQYVAGVSPDTPGWQSYHVYPQMGSLKTIDVVVPSVKGNIETKMAKKKDSFSLTLLSPASTQARVGIPVKFDNGAKVNQVDVNGKVVTV